MKEVLQIVDKTFYAAYIQGNNCEFKNEWVNFFTFVTNIPEYCKHWNQMFYNDAFDVVG